MKKMGEKMTTNIDKQKFGAFISMLRKEKGMTQKELARKLSISDKAVSKWETAASVPKIDLLMPLADIFGVTVTELLMCQRLERENALSATQVEQVVKTAISYPKEKPPRAYHTKSKWRHLFPIACALACIEAWLCYKSGCMTVGLIVSLGLSASFGAYFFFLVKERLPAYYDECRICLYTDGIFEMNLPGLSFNNKNWGKILTAARAWSVAIMLFYPIVCYILSFLFKGIWLDVADLILCLSLTLGGLFIPIYRVGKKCG